ncbi:hypothetical protein BC374_24170 [Ensifer sp. LC13]|nr:hypothetical protein BC362_25145 [Ensifer sp. LC14]OCP06124.1 hypothetical protein BBX50_23945 [Ensifer sp. LC11]OCP07074.1 hypothetical protein BC374_24170 [Ensifer sp. LC13]OCP31472.1 hypothetical protein BC364_23485 [Ensifer sp. LC499]
MAGMTLRAKGTATLATTTKIATIPHGVAYTPSSSDIKIDADGFANNAPGEFIADTLGRQHSALSAAMTLAHREPR